MKEYIQIRDLISKVAKYVMYKIIVNAFVNENKISAKIRRKPFIQH